METIEYIVRMLHQKIENTNGGKRIRTLIWGGCMKQGKKENIKNQGLNYIEDDLDLEQGRHDAGNGDIGKGRKQETLDQPKPRKQRVNINRKPINPGQSGGLFTRHVLAMMVVSILLIVVSGMALLAFVTSEKLPAHSDKAQPKGMEVVMDTGEGKNGFLAPAASAPAKEAEGLQFLTPPRKTNVLLLGLDQSGLLSDVVVVASFDSKTKAIDLISIPRDTYVTLSKSQVQELWSAGRKSTPSHGSMKMTDLHSYAGAELGHTYSQMMAEKLLGIEIDYYVEIKLDAFRQIVDLVDGIYMDIPSGGLHYSDPEQNLYINVPGGYQLLDGKMAEGVVRYRATYSMGDLERIDMQKRFMKEFFAQAVNADTLLKNPTNMVRILLQYVKTDFGLGDLPQYLTSLNDLSADNMSFYTMPGYPEYQGNGWYYIQDEEATERLMRETLLNYDEAPPATEPPVAILARLHLYNGSFQTSILGEKADMLTEGGYQVVSGGDFVGPKTNKTRILIPDDNVEVFKELKSMFASAEIVPNSEVGDGYDAIVILGKNET